MYCSVMLKDLHQLFKVNFNFISLLLYITRIFTSVWSSIFNYYFYSVYKISSYHFNSIVHVFWEWLSTIFRKYWYSLNDKNENINLSFTYSVILLVNEFNQNTNLIYVLIVLNNENWLFKNCHLIKIIQLHRIKINKLLMLKSVSLDLFIQ